MQAPTCSFWRVCIRISHARGDVGLDPLMSIPLEPRSVTVEAACTQRLCARPLHKQSTRDQQWIVATGQISAIHTRSADVGERQDRADVASGCK